LIELDWPWFFGDRRPDKKTVTKKAPSTVDETISLVESTLVAQDQEPDQLALSETLDGFLSGYSSFRSSPQDAVELDSAVQQSHGDQQEEEKDQVVDQEDNEKVPDPQGTVTDSPSKEHCIPKSLEQVLEIKESFIPNSGKGVFAKIKIPKHTYLGFYFGVPYDEDEFDSLKEGVGVASQYAHRYKNTVLDATNEQGVLYDEVIPELFCPFHYINEDLKKANIAFIDGHVVNQIICMTLKEIKVGEELYVNYGPEIPRPWLVESNDAPPALHVKGEEENKQGETLDKNDSSDKVDVEINHA
jgi:prepilin-type processing-associated H-X9-DG protein